MCRTIGVSGLILFSKRYLFSRQSLGAVNSRPRNRCVPATLKLVIDALMTSTTIAGGQLGSDNKPIVVLALLIRSGLVTVETSDALLAVTTHFIFVHNR